ncbi:hypothetical protein C8J56DRAFT_1127466 [Mycena floridula]|nr:hypothetical protein C8J56DRAFT_1127466 [Mycena floridula]
MSNNASIDRGPQRAHPFIALYLLMDSSNSTFTPLSPAPSTSSNKINPITIAIAIITSLIVIGLFICGILLWRRRSHARKIQAHRRRAEGFQMKRAFSRREPALQATHDMLKTHANPSPRTTYDAPVPRFQAQNPGQAWYTTDHLTWTVQVPVPPPNAKKSNRHHKATFIAASFYSI